jgi:hypothetical protein
MQGDEGVRLASALWALAAPDAVLGRLISHVRCVCCNAG